MWKKSLLAIIATLIAIYVLRAPEKSTNYDQWKITHGLHFGNAEDAYRRSIFRMSEQEVEEFNQREGQTYQKGINQFSHMTDEEFLRQFSSGAKITQKVVDANKPFTPTAPDIDWVLNGKVSPVKNQGNCDAGYAFSTTGLLESYYLISKGSNNSLSDQQLVDCSTSYGTKGCQGGSRSGAMNYVKDKGLAFDSQYPYKGMAQTCKLDTGTNKITGYSNTTGCDGIASALRQSPLSVAVDASNWKAYRSGVFSNCTEKVTQDALLVGQTTNYWKVKNSWGLGWGEYGYIRLALGNTCGICGITAYWPN